MAEAFNNWLTVREAAVAVLEGKAKRIDGDGFKVYKVSERTIRIDIPLSPRQEEQDGR